jgi:hypothetical protein
MIQWFNGSMIASESPMLIPHPPVRVRKRPPKARPAAQVPAPINTIVRVTIQEDLKTIDIFFTPGTHVTAVNEPGDNFFVNYSGGQTSGSNSTIVNPAQVRIVLSDVIDAPATWEVDSADLFTFASGTFAGPNGGDVVFE